MAAFAFKLEPVLKHRRMTEDQKQRQLAKLLRERYILESQLRSLQQSITDDKGRMSNSLVGQVDVTRIRQHGAHWSQATQRAHQIAVKLLGLHRRIDQSRAQLLEATKARKALELLRQRQYERWETEQKRREAAELDEVGTQGHVRRMREATV